MQNVGIPHAEGLSLAEGVDVIPLINANLIHAARNLPNSSSWPMTEFPNHWVVVIGEVSKDVTRMPCSSTFGLGATSSSITTTAKSSRHCAANGFAISLHLTGWTGTLMRSQNVPCYKQH